MANFNDLPPYRKWSPFKAKEEEENKLPEEERSEETERAAIQQDVSNLPEQAPTVDEEAASQEEQATLARTPVQKIAAPKESDFTAKVTSAGDRAKALEAISDKLPESERAAYQSRIAEFQDNISNAEELHRQGEERINWAQAADIIGQALTQMAAGYYGLRTGYDMSGVKFSKVDWESKMDRLFNKYDKDVNRYLSQKKDAQGALDDASKDQKRLAERERDKTLDRFEKEDKRAQSLKDELNKQKFETEKFNASEENRYNALGMKLDAALNKSKEKASAKGTEKSDKEAEKYNANIQNALTLNREVSTGKTASGESISAKELKKKEEMLRTISTKVLGLDADEYQKAREAKTGGVLGFFKSKDPEALDKTLKAKEKPIGAPAAPAPTSQPVPGTGGKIRVRRKSDGVAGSIDAKDMDDSKYDKL